MNKNRILLVDDDPDVRLSLRMPLEAAGYKISEATNPKEGLSEIKKEKPDLLILDVMMDSATAGFQFALDLHSEDPKSEYKDYKDIPIIILTAIHDTTSLRFSPDQDYLPVQTFLEKPVEPEVLLSTVKKLLDN